MCVPGLSRKPADISTYVAQESIYMGGVCQRLRLHIPFTKCIRNWTGASDQTYCLAVGWLHIIICVFLYSNSALCLSHCWSLQTSDLAGILLWCNRYSLTKGKIFFLQSQRRLQSWIFERLWNIKIVGIIWDKINTFFTEWGIILTTTGSGDTVVLSLSSKD